MTKYVRETKAGKSITAYVIMKGRREVAKVLAHYSDAGVCLVNVWQDSDGVSKCAKANGGLYSGKTNELFQFQHATAGGGGYDKFSAALSGMWIDGHRMTDHCGTAKKPPNGCPVFPVGYKAPRGYQLANWDPGEAGWRSCYRLAGLDYLRDIGYTVVQVL
jgi:hypothetical protein